MSDLIARTAGLPGLTCDLAQLSIGDSTALLELIAFHGSRACASAHAALTRFSYQVAGWRLLANHRPGAAQRRR